MTYAYIVPIYSIKVVLYISSLKCLDVQWANVQNAYLNFNPKERLYFYAGEGFSKYWGKLVIVVRELHGLEGYGSAWEEDLGFQPCMTDSDSWMRSVVEASAIKSGDVSLNIFSKKLPSG